MTRNSVNSTLSRVYWIIALTLAVSLVAKFADLIPGLAGTPLEAIARESYDWLKDMSLLLATGGVAYLTNVFQKRSKFVESLEEEWRNIVRTKSVLLNYCERPYHSTDDYLIAYNRISETLDTMRIVYRNAGETDGLIGLYPYAPLHDMRRVLQTLDPRQSKALTDEQRKLAKSAMLQAFYSLRETFLEELDLEEPSHPLLISGARRLKVPGAAVSALVLQDIQRRQLERAPTPRPDVDALLTELREKEKDAGPSTNGNGSNNGNGSYPR
ncbi:MAG: hypothetical protein ACRCS9_14545 [Hyphomicrobium sp.]